MYLQRSHFQINSHSEVLGRQELSDVVVEGGGNMVKKMKKHKEDKF